MRLLSSPDIIAGIPSLSRALTCPESRPGLPGGSLLESSGSPRLLLAIRDRVLSPRTAREPSSPAIIPPTMAAAAGPMPKGRNTASIARAPGTRSTASAMLAPAKDGVAPNPRTIPLRMVDIVAGISSSPRQMMGSVSLVSLKRKVASQGAPKHRSRPTAGPEIIAAITADRT